MDFTDEEEDILINLVCKYPTLYDISVENYKNNLIKDNIWKDIGKELNKNSEDCKKKWRYIRDAYSRFKRKNKLGTGSAAPKNSKIKTYEQLKFLENIPQHRSGGSNIPLSETQDKIDTREETSQDIQVTEECTEVLDNENMQESTQQNNTEEIDTEKKQAKKSLARKRRLCNSKEETVIKYLKERDDRRENLLKNITKKDDIEFFSQHMVEVLRNLPQIYKAQAKKQINDVLSHFEILAATDMNNSAPSSLASNLSSGQNQFNIISYTPFPRTSPTETIDSSEYNSQQQVIIHTYSPISEVPTRKPTDLTLSENQVPIQELPNNENTIDELLSIHLP